MLQPPIQCCSPQHLRLQRAASGFTRLMIEKPFGRDSPTFNVLNALTSNHFKESQLFRLDHYLGKEVTLNTASLLTLDPTLTLPGQGGHP